MYCFIEDKAFLKAARATGSETMQMLVDRLLKAGISSHFVLIGSGARNLVVEDDAGNVFLEYYLILQKDADINDGKAISKVVRKNLNKITRSFKIGRVEADGASFITEPYFIEEYPKRLITLEVNIVYEDEEGRFIKLHAAHSRFFAKPKYFWAEIPYSDILLKRSKAIKAHNVWDEDSDFLKII